MNQKLRWCGLTLLLVSPVLGIGHAFVVAGAIILTVGTILLLLDK